MVDAERLARLLPRVTDDVGRLRPHAADADGLLGDAVRLDHVKYLGHDPPGSKLIVGRSPGRIDEVVEVAGAGT
jgi:hypothetical protein